MALGKIDHIDLSVCDLKKAEKYFTEKLRFKLLRYTEPKKSVELQSPAGDFFFHLHQGDEGLLFSQINHIAFSIDDINKEYEDLKSKGVSFSEDAPTSSPTSGRKPAHILDFDAHFWVELVRSHVAL